MIHCPSYSCLADTWMCKNVCIYVCACACKYESMYFCRTSPCLLYALITKRIYIQQFIHFISLHLNIWKHKYYIRYSSPNTQNVIKVEMCHPHWMPPQLMFGNRNIHLNCYIVQCTKRKGIIILFFTVI